MNNRHLVDAELRKSAALPNANATSNTGAIDTGATEPFNTLHGNFTARLSSTVGNGANNKNINIRLQDSADGETFANIATLANPMIQVTDDNGGGYPADEVEFVLPPGTQRYIRAQAQGEANGGDASNGEFTFELIVG